LQEIGRAAAELFHDTGLIDVSIMMVITMDDHIASLAAKLSVVAEMDGRIAGVAMGEMHDDNAYLRKLDLDPVLQQRGAGAALVNAFANGATWLDASAVFLSTYRFPPWSTPFYRKQGFRNIASSDYLPWMQAIEREQAMLLDIEKRVFLMPGV